MSKKNKKSLNNEFKFFNFIYLNSHLLESFTAQKHNGFPQNIQTEKNLEHSDNLNGPEFSAEATIDNEIGSEKKLDKILSLLKVLNIKISAKINSGHFDLSNIESKKSIISKTQNDNMYHNFIDYIEDNNLLTNSENAEIGKYIKLCDEFYYVDFERLQTLYDEKFKKLHSQNDFDEIKNKIELLNELIPFDALLYNRKFIILIDKDCLKEKKEQLGYTLSGKINIVGRVGKQIENQKEKPKLINTLDEMQKYALSLLCDLGFLQNEKAYLIIPIAIYY